jgi:hypothetical protein
VDATQDATPGPRVVVLNELIRDAALAECLPVVALQKQATVVAVDGRLNDQDAVERSRPDRDRQCRRS